MASNTTATTLETLSLDDCLELLRSQHFGRFAVVSDGQPMIFPVNYTVEDDTVVFRTDPGTKLDAGNLGRVAFEIDGTDDESRCGWSVVVQGVGQDVTDSVDRRSESLRNLEVDTWVPGARSCWVAIANRSITGRRLSIRDVSDGDGIDLA